MRKIIASAFLSLDGVIQAPGGPNEDTTGGFAHGGWLSGYFDTETGAAVDALFDGSFDLLLGRRTYDIFAAYWPFVSEDDEGGLGQKFDRAAKYVVTGGDQPLDWANSHRLADIDAVAALKRQDGPDLIIQGSGSLYPPLLAAGLIDRLTLMTFPVVLGSGKRLFGEGAASGSMKLVESRVTPGGAVIAAYAPDGAVRGGSMEVIEPTPAERARRRRMEAGDW